MKTIVITGSSRGLGKAMAEGFLARGHRVFGCSRSGKPDEDDFFACDVADDRSVKDFAAAVLGRAGPPDLLINNAALINRTASLWEFGDEEFSRIVDVNIGGTVNMIRHFLPAMIRSGSGVVVNFSSYWGRSVSAEVTPYCTTKWAIEGLSRGLALELPDGMASVALNPGVIHTDMLESCFGEGAASHISPEDWAELAVPFIESLEASNNGESLTVPGQ